jgi:mono/diheme cytochrome c family protein
MVDQARCEPDDRCSAFDDGISNQLPPAATIPWRSSPRAVLERGRDRFEIFCGVCHGIAGDGVSEVAENMSLRPPPSLVSDPIASYPPGRVFAIIELGYGLMPSYADRLTVADRWAVAAYVGALQLSQRSVLAELPSFLQEEAKRWLP